MKTFDETLHELVQFDIDQHDKACGVTITKDHGNCDCNKTEFKQALKEAIEKHIISLQRDLHFKRDIPQTLSEFMEAAAQIRETHRKEQRVALWGKEGEENGRRK